MNLLLFYFSLTKLLAQAKDGDAGAQIRSSRLITQLISEMDPKTVRVNRKHRLFSFAFADGTLALSFKALFLD